MRASRPVNETTTDRVGQFWNWLPAFRAVAEAGAVNVAARRCGISPSALSRSIRLLEHAIGEQLFHRERGKLVLTQHGAQALAAAQDAMRLVDEAFIRRAPAQSEAPPPVAVASGSDLVR